MDNYPKLAVAIGIPNPDEPKWREGAVLGVRTLAEGDTELHDFQDVGMREVLYVPAPTDPQSDN